MKEGENLLEIIEEANEPIITRYGFRLLFIVKPLGSDDRYTLMVMFRENVGENNLLGQLKKIADERGGLRGLKLNIICDMTSGLRRYKVQLLEE
ncbi:MAG: hypothetical protein QW118_08380 [Nitrososphaerota archaeon]